MKLLVLSFLALWAAVVVADDVEIAVASQETALALHEDGIVALAPSPTNDDLETAKRALEALASFIDIFNSDLFDKKDGTIGVKQVAEILTKIVSFVVSIINLVQGITGGESTMMKYLREQFAEVHAKLDGISIQLGDVKRLIEWQTTRVVYARFESFIIATSHMLDSYVKAPEHEREIRKSQFITSFQSNRLAPFKLYQAVVETQFVVADNLAAAVVHYSQNHRRQTMNFLLAMSRLILRGAQIEIAYERLAHGEASGKLVEADWGKRMEKLSAKVYEVDNMVKNAWHGQMQRDVSRILLEQRGLSNEQFSGHMYNFLADKFHWHYWISLAYNEVSGFNNHAITYCNGVHHFRTYGRNMMVASSNPKTSRFTQDRGNQLLAAAESAGHRTTNAETWVNEINNRVGNYCDDAAFRGAICWGCNVWFTMLSNRYAYRKMTIGGNVNTILFG